MFTAIALDRRGVVMNVVHNGSCCYLVSCFGFWKHAALCSSLHYCITTTPPSVCEVNDIRHCGKPLFHSVGVRLLPDVERTHATYTSAYWCSVFKVTTSAPIMQNTHVNGVQYRCRSGASFCSTSLRTTGYPCPPQPYTPHLHINLLFNIMLCHLRPIFHSASKLPPSQNSIHILLWMTPPIFLHFTSLPCCS